MNKKSTLSERIAKFKDELSVTCHDYFYGRLFESKSFSERMRIAEILFMNYDQTFAMITHTFDGEEREEAKSIFSMLICDNLFGEFIPPEDPSLLGTAIFDWLCMKLRKKLLEHRSSKNNTLQIVILEPGTVIYASPDDKSGNKSVLKRICAEVRPNGNLNGFICIVFHTKFGDNEVYSVFAKESDARVTVNSTFSMTCADDDDENDQVIDIPSDEKTEDSANVYDTLDFYLGKASACVVDYLAKMRSGKPVYERMFFSEDVIRLVQTIDLVRNWKFGYENECLSTADYGYMRFLFGDPDSEIDYRYISSNDLITYRKAIGCSEPDRPIELKNGENAGSKVYKAYFEREKIPCSENFNVTMSRRFSAYKKCISVFNHNVVKEIAK